MLNNDMRIYNYFTFGELNAYGQPELSQEPKGQVKMAIYITNQNVQDNINYKGATYTGLTHSLLDDTCVIDYNGTKLKVLYINAQGRFNQVFMAEI